MAPPGSVQLSLWMSGLRVMGHSFFECVWNRKNRDYAFSWQQIRGVEHAPAPMLKHLASRGTDSPRERGSKRWKWGDSKEAAHGRRDSTDDDEDDDEEDEDDEKSLPPVLGADGDEAMDVVMPMTGSLPLPQHHDYDGTAFNGVSSSYSSSTPPAAKSLPIDNYGRLQPLKEAQSAPHRQSAPPQSKRPHGAKHRKQISSKMELVPNRALPPGPPGRSGKSTSTSPLRLTQSQSSNGVFGDCGSLKCFGNAWKCWRCLKTVSLLSVW